MLSGSSSTQTINTAEMDASKHTNSKRVGLSVAVLVALCIGIGVVASNRPNEAAPTKSIHLEQHVTARDDLTPSFYYPNSQLLVNKASCSPRFGGGGVPGAPFGIVTPATRVTQICVTCDLIYVQSMKLTLTPVSGSGASSQFSFGVASAPESCYTVPTGQIIQKVSLVSGIWLNGIKFWSAPPNGGTLTGSNWFCMHAQTPTQKAWSVQSRNGGGLNGMVGRAGSVIAEIGFCFE